MDSPISDFLTHTSGIATGDDASALTLESEFNDVTSLNKSDDFASKRYLLFDQGCCGSRRIISRSQDENLSSTLGFRCRDFEAHDRRIREPNLERVSFHGTVALGIAALENARAARASCSSLSSLFGPFRTLADDDPHFVQGAESGKLKVSESDINALLTPEDDEDEVTSSVTLPDGADDTGYYSVDLDFDSWSENRRKRMRCGERTRIKENLGTSDVHLQSERESIKQKLKVLGSIVGGGCTDTVALLDEAIHFVKNLQHQVGNLL